ncbi:MAG: cysteine-rich KTR domain-containing protein [Lachnospiraceae bacterium]|nr:cysteine-rich KTR domain-containing protein [Lachnospiraceae bacterium]
MEKTKWIYCPICGSKTRNKMREDTVLKKFPLYCPKCKQENLISVKSFDVNCDPWSLWRIRPLPVLFF